MFRFAAVFASLVACVSGATAVTHASVLAAMPRFVARLSTPAFSLDTRVLIKQAPIGDGETGKADFRISVTVNAMKEAKPVSFTVASECKDEEFLLEDSLLVFDPYPEEGVTCTHRFIEEMNAKFGGSVVPSPLELTLAADGSKLTFSILDAKVDLTRA